MLKSDCRREAHMNFQNYFFCTHCVFFQHIDAKSTLISRKIKVHLEYNFHLSVSIEVFNHYNAANIKNKIILGV